MSTAEAILFEEDSPATLAGIRTELLAEYRQGHAYPWIIGYSGGKDSTLVAHLVFEMLLELAPSQRRRQVHIVGNDTLVESPLVAGHLATSLAEMRHAAEAFDLPITTAITEPATDQTFWVNLIGRGYPSPNQKFRWCTDRMKIQPTSRYIKEQVAASGEVILLLGVRRTESATRAASISRYDNGQRLNKHNDLPGCMVFRPIVDLATDEVWEFLALNDPPWGGSHKHLIDLYRNAAGGECPVVMSLEDAPGCGTNSARFGCWTCTVVKKDKSLAGFVEAGFDEFTPMLEFRDWLVEIRNDPARRQARRRDGRITLTRGGTFIPGPFTLQARREILDRLRALEIATGQGLISAAEIDRIHEIWAEDLAANARPPNMNCRRINKGK